VKCPFCEYQESRVLDSRETDDNTTIRRRRECAGCLRRFTTYERYEETPLVVIKKDLRREKFERAKILTTLSRAFEKRPVSLARQEALVNSIERELRNRGESEVNTAEIGDLVLRHLKDIDAVAYIRFASVYKNFQDVGAFIRELNELEAARLEA
jgi:transcriptional repressor NrdR